MKKRIKAFGYNLIKKENRIFLFLLIFILAYGFYEFGENYIFHFFIKPTNNEIYVDLNSKFWGQSGAEKYPFKNIEPALELAARNKSLNTVFVKGGPYKERIRVPKGVDLISQDNMVSIIYPKENFSPQEIIKYEIKKDPGGGAVVLEGDNFIKGLDIKKGFYGVFILKDANVNLVDCKVSQAKHYGVYNQEYSDLNSGKISIFNCTVSENGSQGIYLQKSNFSLRESLIERNAEEGVDLHIGMNSYIKNCIIRENGESGIETELGENRVIIEENFIHDNLKQGIALQSDLEGGFVSIKNNKIKNNGKFGLRCVVHEKTLPDYFNRAFEKDIGFIISNNQIIGNGQDRKKNDGKQYSSRCNH
ncbi:MAG: hypothetical protein GF335_02255 [Candidatus Moranbacteria bacterium]|nr:hypothetical protein [Candidatus Moranbacteria bacterium]